MTAVADDREWQTYMPYKGDHQVLIKQSITHQAGSGETR